MVNGIRQKIDLKDILLIGDSYCYQRFKSEDWPVQLVELLTGNEDIPRGEGFAGCSWWSVRQKLLKELKVHVPKLLILIHTEPFRIPSNYDFPLNSKSVENMALHIKNHKHLAQYDEELSRAAQYYYKHLFSNDFHIWSVNSWYREVDELCKDIPFVIHMSSFEPFDGVDFTFKHGMYIEEDLFGPSKSNVHFKSLPFEQWLEKERQLRNHLNYQENTALAHKLYNAINTYSLGKRNLGLY